MRADGDFGQVHDLVSDLSLHTVCQSAKCPNIHECWGHGTATLMLLGNICTRDCTFCSIPAGRPEPLDISEPERVARAATGMNLRHLVLTSVARDDLADGGSTAFADTIRAVKEALPEISIEVLTSDFEGRPESIDQVLEAGPDVFNHNLETVRRFQPVIRPQAAYGRSLSVLKQAAEHPLAPVVKSGLMVGLGESEDELFQAMEDLLSVGCELLTLGQYLQPTRFNARVVRYVTPEAFAGYAERAKAMGFKGIASGPMVRSSYKADELLDAARRSQFAAVS
jgi:lipoic acid synthetase